MKLLFLASIALMAMPALLPARAEGYSAFQPHHKPHKVKRHKGVKHHNN